MKIYLTSFLSLFIIILLSNCSDSTSKTGKSRFTMRQDSELTILMRDMHNYYDSLRLQIEKGEVPQNIKDFSEIHSAISTEPSKAESPLFQAMATVYMESAKKLNDSKTNMPEVFNHMIDNCMNCHKQMCPGPMVRIKKLYVNKD